MQSAEPVLFFDLDDTLYPKTDGVWQLVTQRIASYMITKMGLPEEHVPAIMDECYKKHGMTLAGLRKQVLPAHLGHINYKVNEWDFLDYVHGGLPYDEIIKPNPVLGEMLRSIPYKKYILSNSDPPHIRRVLRRLGISDCFEAIIDIFALDWQVKPSAAAYKTALRLAGLTDADAPRCYFFDDSIKNIVGAKAVGFKTVWVSTDEKHACADWSLLTIEEMRTRLCHLYPSAGKVTHNIANTTVLLMEVDDVLYPKNLGFWEIITQRIAFYLVTRVGLAEHDVPLIMDECYRKYGNTLAGLRRGVVPPQLSHLKYTIDVNDFLDFVHGGLPYDIIDANPNLRMMLKSIPIKKYVLSNGDAAHCARVLERVGLTDAFECIIDIRALDYNPKASVAAVKRAMELCGEADASKYVFVDAAPRNMAAAKELGMYTVLVSADQQHPAPHLCIPRVDSLRTALPQLWQTGVARSKDYLKNEVKPLLVRGLVELCKNDDQWMDPIEWLAHWLVQNNTRKSSVGAINLYNLSKPRSSRHFTVAA